MPGTSPSPEREERSLGQARALDRSVRTRAVARAGRTLDDVPEVVESPVGMLRVDLPYVGEPHPPLVHEDERIDPLVRHHAGRQGFQDRETHHPDERGVFHEDGITLRLHNLFAHVSHLPLLLDAPGMRPSRMELDTELRIGTYLASGGLLTRRLALCLLGPRLAHRENGSRGDHGDTESREAPLGSRKRPTGEVVDRDRAGAGER